MKLFVTEWKHETVNFNLRTSFVKRCGLNKSTWVWNKFEQG